MSLNRKRDILIERRFKTMRRLIALSFLALLTVHFSAPGKILAQPDSFSSRVPRAFFNWRSDGKPLLSRSGPGYDESRLEEPVLLKYSDKYSLFYASWSRGSTFGSIGYAVGDRLSSLSKRGRVLLPGTAGQWDDAYVSGPRIFHENGLYYLYYFGSSKVSMEGEPASIGVATSSSPDGPWTRYENNPIVKPGSSGAWDDAILFRPFLFKLNDEYHLFYNAKKTSDGMERIGCASASSPLGPFTKSSSNPVLQPGSSGQWDDQRIGDPQIIRCGDIFVMFYYGAQLRARTAKMGIAYSTDLKTWTKSPHNPVPIAGLPAGSLGIRPDVQFVAGEWVMVYDDEGTNVLAAYGKDQ
jgi:predicted GH43/DUF377 family glycosyl hydrolase